MSSDPYARYLIQKYKLAVAIAVIQTTPETKTLDQHIIDLKNKFHDEKSDDLDITICSDDFDVDFNENDLNLNEHTISQNSFTILKDFNDTTVATNSLLENNEKEVCPDVLDLVNINNDCSQDQNCQMDTQSTFCETQTQIDISLAPNSLTDIDKTFCDSIARIHEENIMDIDKTCDEIAKIYKTCNTVTNERIQQPKHFGTKCINTDETNTEKIKSDLNKQKWNDDPIIHNNGPTNYRQYHTGITFDSQATELYTIPCHTQNYTHVSQSQTQNFDISDKYIKGPNKNTTHTSRNENIDDRTTNSDFGCLGDINLAAKINRNLDKESFKQVETYNFNVNSQIDDNNITDNREINTNLTQADCPLPLAYIPENTFPQHFTDGRLARKICNNLDQINITITNDFHNNQFINTQDYRNDSNLQESQITCNAVIDNTENMQDHYNINQTQQQTIQTNNEQEITEKIIALREISKNSKENATMQVYYTENEQDTHFKDVNEAIMEDLNVSDSSEEIARTELVPFKVIEELNRVKSYLNKRVERRMSNESSLDSGYRSDSQGFNSQGRKSGFQLSLNWVGQSGHCLFDHITTCPLVNATEDILAEISEVLGQLIDTLHEQESYPSFLEELLSHVESLIQSVFTEDEMVLDKDEKIQRLFLLNKSIHIQKYSIEKLTDILENVHTTLNNSEELFELTDIQKTENLAYIFHILEVILRSSKNKRNSRYQSSSQESLKPKTSISDIWRRKWNPNYKEQKIESNVEKKCVFKKCSEVLNKIVVGCMDGYSLVSFAALQCFNLLQS